MFSGGGVGSRKYPGEYLKSRQSVGWPGREPFEAGHQQKGVWDMAITAFGRKWMIDRINAATSESDLKKIAGDMSDSAKRDAEIYAALLRAGRAMKRK